MTVTATTENEVDAEDLEVAEEVDADDDTGAATDKDDAEDDAAEVNAAEDDGDEGPLLRRKEKTKRFNRPWRHYLRRSILPLLLAASLGVSGYLGWLQWQAHQLKVAGQEAQQAAIKYAGVLTSIDSNNVDENFRQVLDGATGEFKDMYTQSSVQLRQLLIDNKATAHGVVVDSAIASETANKVVVLVFIDQTVANMAVPDPRIDRSRIKMTMEKVDGRWRASKVQLL
ncbi:YfgM family protein [Mycobacterium camsae]|uniref:DUF3329 domain-containing protein n=1 Tax=Mycobacterium gordonae TaxID=1778 RepID=UPI00197E5219|nr:DUF3329 domain-containing protein [Mycobacterium gordonae]